MNVKAKKNLQALVESAVFVGLALALSTFKIKTGGEGGSIDFVMIPIIISAYRWGMLWGMGAGLVFGTLKFFLGGNAFSWEAILLDYSVAYALVGVGGFLKRKNWMLPVVALIGCLARYAAHVVSGAVIWGEWMPSEYLGLPMNNPWIYSIIYNALYMSWNTLIAVVVCALIYLPLKKILLKDFAK